jgi:hypothetical protein
LAGRSRSAEIYFIPARAGAKYEQALRGLFTTGTSSKRSCVMVKEKVGGKHGLK